MTLLWVILAAMVLAALAFILPPLLGRGRDTGLGREQINLAIYKERLAEIEADLKSGALSREQFRQSRQDLERQLLQDISGDKTPAHVTSHAPARWSAGVVVLSLPLLAMSLYLKLGGGDLMMRWTQADGGTAGDVAQTPPGMPSIEQMVNGLAQRMKTTPNDLQGWVMLGRSYIVLKRYPDAVAAYAKAYSLQGDDPRILTDYAEALALANDNQLSGRPAELIQKALELRPSYAKALWLAGIVAVKEGNMASAVGRWQQLLVQLPKDSEEARMVQSAIAQAQGQAPAMAVAEGGAAGQGAQSGEGGAIKLKVALSPELASKASPDDTLFIFARASSGPRMPLAVVRKQVKDLPVTVTLNDSMAMTPAMKLSNFPEVVLEARVSKAGTAAPQAGDLEGRKQGVKTGGQDVVDLNIDQVVKGEPSAQGDQPSVATMLANTGSADAGGQNAAPAAEPAATPIAPAAGKAPMSLPQAKQEAAGGTGIEGGGIQVRVALAPSLGGKVSPDDTLFIFARVANGPRMPLAIVRKQAKELPVTVTLNDSMAMMPAMRLSNFPAVVVGARISKTGMAMPQSGDLEGMSPGITVGGSAPVDVTIDHLIP